MSFPLDFFWRKEYFMWITLFCIWLSSFNMSRPSFSSEMLNYFIPIPLQLKYFPNPEVEHLPIQTPSAPPSPIQCHPIPSSHHKHHSMFLKKTKYNQHLCKLKFEYIFDLYIVKNMFMFFWLGTFIHYFHLYFIHSLFQSGFNFYYGYIQT